MSAHVHGVLRTDDHVRVMIYWRRQKKVADIWTGICCAERALEFAPTSQYLRPYIWIDDDRAPAELRARLIELEGGEWLTTLAEAIE